MSQALLRSITTLCFLLTVSVTWAQQVPADEQIRGTFTNYSFEQFVKEIESKSPYRFYYRVADIDSLQINLGSRNATVPDLIKEIFKEGYLHATIDSEHNIFITKDREIFAELLFDISGRDTTSATTTNQRVVENEKATLTDDTRPIEIGSRTNSTGNATIAGYIRDDKTGEAVIGASVYVEKPLTGTITDQFGYYAITLPKGNYGLNVKSVGMKSVRREIRLNSNGKLDIELHEEVTALKEVIVSSQKDVNIKGMQMGLERLDIKMLKQVPVALGEYDVIKVLLTLPGVQTVGEGASGFNVRGGATNQNLILFNDATIYNSSHLFGFFSTFNPDMVKNVELYKSGIPAEYGGRLSSVLEVDSPDGNKKKFSGSGGIGLATSRLMLEGPIKKDKTSFMVAGRSTYSNWLLHQVSNKTLQNSAASFYDLNAKVTHEFNDKNTIYATGYMSKDNFRLNSDTTYMYQNKAATIKWKHSFNNKLYGVFKGTYSGYDYAIASDQNPVNAYRMTYAINQTQAKADFSYFHSAKHTFSFGGSTIHYKLNPGSLQPLGAESLITPDVVQSEQAMESAVYAGDNFEISSPLAVYLGIRYSFFNYLGPKDVLTYSEGQPRNENTVTGTLTYPAGKDIATYQGPEYRASARYTLTSTSSIKLSYNKMRQYIQMLSNTTAISPTDIWKLSDSYIKPQIGDQIALGFYKNLKGNTIETSVEGYYKTMKNSLDYKSGATLILNHNIEQDVLSAEGRAYGVEFMVKKLSGKLNGWMSYTYSRSLLQTRSTESTETINGGKLYPSNYDKPHAVNLIGNYKFSRRFSISLNMTYSTGRPITLPLAKYDLNGTKRVYYSERNQYRIPDYFRTDFSMNIEGNHKIKKLAHSSWTVAVYNLTGRRNAYSVYYVSQEGTIKGYKLSIFGNPIPTVTYNFRF